MGPGDGEVAAAEMATWRLAVVLCVRVCMSSWSEPPGFGKGLHVSACQVIHGII